MGTRTNKHHLLLKTEKRTGTGATPGPWSTYQSYATSQTDSVTHGPNWPSYKSRIRNHISATTSLTGVRYKATVSRGDSGLTIRKNTGSTGSGTRTEVRGSLAGVHAYYFSDPGASFSSANNTALVSFIHRVNAIHNEAQALPFIGEIREAVRMIRNPFQLLYKGKFDFLNRTKRFFKKPMPVRKVREMAANNWLEYSFGVKPLISDITSGANALARLAEEVPPSKRVNGFGQSITLVENEDGILEDYGDIRFRATRIRTVENNVSYHGAVGVDPPSYNGLFGLTPYDVIPAVYELIPWSFLVDYFSNLQGIIEGVSFNRSRILWTEKGTKARHICKIVRARLSAETQTLPNYYSVQALVCAPNATLVRESVTREAYDGNFIPSLEFRIPGTSTKWLNMLSLAASHNSARSYAYRNG